MINRMPQPPLVLCAADKTSYFIPFCFHALHFAYLHRDLPGSEPSYHGFVYVREGCGLFLIPESL
jgi:hypothetical protein